MVLINEPPTRVYIIATLENKKYPLSFWTVDIFNNSISYTFYFNLRFAIKLRLRCAKKTLHKLTKLITYLKTFSKTKKFVNV